MNDKKITFYSKSLNFKKKFNIWTEFSQLIIFKQYINIWTWMMCTEIECLGNLFQSSHVHHLFYTSHWDVTRRFIAPPTAKISRNCSNSESWETSSAQRQLTPTCTSDSSYTWGQIQDNQIPWPKSTQHRQWQGQPGTCRIGQIWLAHSQWYILVLHSADVPLQSEEGDRIYSQMGVAGGLADI